MINYTVIGHTIEKKNNAFPSGKLHYKIANSIHLAGSGDGYRFSCLKNVASA